MRKKQWRISEKKPERRGDVWVYRGLGLEGIATTKTMKVKRRIESLSKVFEAESIKSRSKTGHSLHTTHTTNVAYAFLKKLESFAIPVVLTFFNFSTPKEGFGAFLFLSPATFWPLACNLEAELTAFAMASSLLIVNWVCSFTKLGEKKKLITWGWRVNDIHVLVRIN